jgi:hypothetical protein
VNRAHIANHIPDKLSASIDLNFLTDGSHAYFHLTMIFVYDVK